MKHWILPNTSKLHFCAIFLVVFFFVRSSALASNPYVFIENKGQWSSEVKFRASIPGGVLWVKNTGLEYDFLDTQLLNELHFGHKDASTLRKAGQKHMAAVEVVFENNYKGSVTYKTSKKLETAYNYFYGSDPTKWVHAAQGFEEVLLENVYQQIDMRLYSLGESLKYEFIVHPGADYRQISLKYTGAEIEADDNGLHYRTAVNSFKEFPPFSFQLKNGKKQKIRSAFKVNQNNVSFDLANFDTSQDLIIDPELVFSTFSGSISDNWSHTATFDSKGNLYAGGSVFGPTFPITRGAAQPNIGGADNNFSLVTDVVIMKYASDGRRLLYATFLGGNASEVPHSLICNSKDELVIYGTTSSSNFPTSPGSYQSSFKGGAVLSGGPITTSIDFFEGTDMFLAILSEDGSTLKGGSYMGGTSNDGIQDYRALFIQNYGDEFRGEVYVDKSDNVYVASSTISDDFPVKNGKSKAASYDGVVFSMSPYLNNLNWSTHVGGNKYDALNGIRVKDDGTVYVVGSTVSDNLPSSTNALHKKNLGEADAFVAVLENGTIKALSYLGTRAEDVGSLIDLDNEGNVYILGLSQGEYPINGTVYSNRGSGQFIHCLSPDLAQTRFSTVIGSGNGVGSIDIVPTAFLVNDCGNIYIAGWGGNVNTARGLNQSSSTLNLPVTADAIQSETTGDNFYIAILAANASSLLYGTYFGMAAPADPENRVGDHLDGGTCRFDKNGYIYHSACVCQRNNDFGGFPTKNALFGTLASDNCNMVAFKIELSALEASFDMLDDDILNPETICAGTELVLTNNSKGANSYQWSIDGRQIARTKDTKYTFPEAGEYKVLLEIFNTQTCDKADSTFRFIKVTSFDTEISNDTIVCTGAKVPLYANGGESYQWSPAIYLDNDTLQSPIATVESNTNFLVEIKTPDCIVKRNINVIVNNNDKDLKVSADTIVCKGSTVNLIASATAEKLIWTLADGSEVENNEVAVLVNLAQSAYATAYYADGCRPSYEVKLAVEEEVIPAFDYEIVYSCGEKFRLEFNNTTNGEASYEWSMGDGSIFSESVPANFEYPQAGNYLITLNAKSKLNCLYTASAMILVPDDDGLIPNVITPNGDGLNDQFKIGITNPHVIIYNRLGQKVFEDLTYKNNWGPNVEKGVYYYEIVLPKGKNCKGWIEVL